MFDMNMVAESAVFESLSLGASQKLEEFYGKIKGPERRA
jgi:hypothetical protein